MLHPTPAASQWQAGRTVGALGRSLPIAKRIDELSLREDHAMPYR
jgi:hypothetical protein